MAIRKWMVVASLALVAVVALTVASVGSAKQTATPFRVALVTDIGGLNDKGFNASAYAGLKRAQAALGVNGRVFISKSAADYIPNLSTGATQGYDMVIAVGFLMSDSTAAVAKRRVFRFEPGMNRETAYLAAAIALLAWATVGSWVFHAVSMLPGGPKPEPGAAADEPRDDRTGEVHWITRPKKPAFS